MSRGCLWSVDVPCGEPTKPRIKVALMASHGDDLDGTPPDSPAQTLEIRDKSLERVLLPLQGVTKIGILRAGDLTPEICEIDRQGLQQRPGILGIEVEPNGHPCSHPFLIQVRATTEQDMCHIARRAKEKRAR